jgi:hypothetical protein
LHRDSAPADQSGAYGLCRPGCPDFGSSRLDEGAGVSGEFEGLADFGRSAGLPGGSGLESGVSM